MLSTRIPTRAEKDICCAIFGSSCQTKQLTSAGSMLHGRSLDSCHVCLLEDTPEGPCNQCLEAVVKTNSAHEAVGQVMASRTDSVTKLE